FVIMPDHIHGIIILNDIVGAKNFSPQPSNNFSPQPSNNFSPQPMPTPQQNITPFRSPSKTIGSIIRGFKIGVTKGFRQNTDIYVVWQRNYYEHIIRNKVELNRMRQYIIDNPKKWKTDENYI
ncbi:MAG: transposase, partial [Bacteroidales bacterium]|nr:transposase [Bacteroidales bacterium]